MPMTRHRHTLAAILVAMLAVFGAAGPFMARDTAAPRGTRATYVVIPLDSAGNRGVAAGDTVTFRDLTRPTAPRAVTAVRERGVVTLAWERVASRDLAGYVVFRLDPGARERRRLTPRPVPEPRLVDRDAPRGAQYVVVAVDRAGNESDDSPPATVVTR